MPYIAYEIYACEDLPFITFDVYWLFVRIVSSICRLV